MLLDLEQREGLPAGRQGQAVGDEPRALSRVVWITPRQVPHSSADASALCMLFTLSSLGGGWDLNSEKPGSIPLCDGIQYVHKESKCLHSGPAKKGALWVIQLCGSGSLAVSSSVSYQCGS